MAEADEKLYAAVLGAMRAAEAEGSAKGWSGMELQAHIVVAALDAANVMCASPELVAAADPVPADPVPVVTEQPTESLSDPVAEPDLAPEIAGEEQTQEQEEAR